MWLVCFVCLRRISATGQVDKRDSIGVCVGCEGEAESLQRDQAVCISTNGTITFSTTKNCKAYNCRVATALKVSKTWQIFSHLLYIPPLSSLPLLSSLQERCLSTVKRWPTSCLLSPSALLWPLIWKWSTYFLLATTTTLAKEATSSWGLRLAQGTGKWCLIGC